MFYLLRGSQSGNLAIYKTSTATTYFVELVTVVYWKDPFMQMKKRTDKPKPGSMGCCIFMSDTYEDVVEHATLESIE